MLLCGFTAAWAAQTVNVVINPAGTGTVTVDPASPIAGSTVTLTVAPAEGYKIAKSDIVVEATINPGSAQLPRPKDGGPSVGKILELQNDDPADLSESREYTFTMPEEPYNVLVTANFTGIPLFNVTVASSEHGTVTADKSQAAEGETVTLTITPDPGYEIDELYYMKGTDKVTITGTSFQMPAGDVEIHATFKKSQALYLIGSFNGWNDATMVPLTKNDEGKWVGTQAMDANGTFKFKDENGTWIGAESNGNCIVQYEYVKNGAALHLAMPGTDFEIPVAGTWTFTVNRDSNPMTVIISGDWYFRVETETPTNGTLSADKDKATEGETVTLTVNPNEGYEIDELYYMKGTEKVTITGTSFQMPAGDVKVYATFKQAEYNITVNSSENGSVTPSKDKATMGETITLTVSPAEGYELESLTVMAGNEAVTVANNQFTMPASDVTITATFKKSTYTITVTEPQNGTVSASAATASMGEVITLTIAPEAGYEVDQIMVVYGENNTPVEVTDNQFTMPAGNVTVTVTFKAVEYTITPETCENGSVTADKEKATAGTTVTLTATAAEGYEVDKFYYKVGETQTVLEGNTFTMPASDVTVGATFKKSTYTITVTQPQNGTVSASAATANMGDVITLTITPEAGYEVDQIMVVYGENNTPVEVTDNQFTMPAGNVTVTVTFKAVEYTITPETCENGSVTADKEKATAGTTVTLTATAAEGYEVDKFYYKVGETQTVLEGNTFTMPASDVTVGATFKKSVYTITVTQPQNGAVSASAATASMGELITLTIEPNDGFVIGTITVTYGENQTVEVVDNQFTMPAGNVTVTVTFVDRKYNVTVEESEHGSVAADKIEAAEGETVKLTITPEAEYELDVLTVDGVAVEVTGNTYEFAMPAHDVTVTATFKAVVHTYTVVGEPAELFGSETPWDLNNDDAEMTQGTDGLYTWTSEPTFLEGDVKFKIVKDNSNDTSYPANDYVIPGLKPGTYTVTVTLNPETGEITVNVEGQADVYVYGDINGNTFVPNQGVKMTSEDGKIYTATVTIPDVENGYGFFAFTHKLSTDAADWATANAYRFLAQSNGNFLVNGTTMNVELPMAYNSTNSMQIPAGDYTLTVDMENMKLTIAGGTQLSYILASGVEGVDYTVINDLAVVENHEGTQQFFTSDGSDNWITIKGGNFFADASLMDAFKGGYVSGVFSEKNWNPYLTLSVAPTEGEDVAEVEPKTYMLSDQENGFAPKVDEVIVVSKAYYKESDNALRAYSPGSGAQGKSLTVDTSLYNYDFKDGYRYNVTGVINIKEPWATTSGINPLDYNYPFQNYKLLVLEVEELAPPTAIDGIIVEEGVKSVRYYNVAGAESTVPFNGVNIIVKEMNDGTRVTTKAIIK